MKCPNCDYEIEKANLKTCPLCGCSLQLEGSDEHLVPTDNAVMEQRDMSVSEEPMTSVASGDVLDNQQTLCPRCHTPQPSFGNFCPICGYDFRGQEEEIPEETETDVDVQTSEPDDLDSPWEPAQVLSETKPHLETDYDEHLVAANSVTAETYDEADEENPQMGGYYPYPEDENASPSSEEESSGKKTSTWLTIAISAVASIIIGALLFVLTQ